MVKFHFPQGATPLEDSEGLKLKGITTMAELNAAEAENIYKAIIKHLHRKRNLKASWFSESFLRKVHKDMLGDVWTWAGQYRKTDTNIGVRAYQIREEMLKLCHDVSYWEKHPKSMSILERAVHIHHRLAWIHPFPNGNGRHARLVSDIYLKAHHHPQPIWPSTIKADEARSQYILALKKADQGNWEPLIALTNQFIKTWDQ